MLCFFGFGYLHSKVSGKGECGPFLVERLVDSSFLIETFYNFAQVHEALVPIWRHSGVWKTQTFLDFEQGKPKKFVSVPRIWRTCRHCSHEEKYPEKENIDIMFRTWRTRDTINWWMANFCLSFSSWPLLMFFAFRTWISPACLDRHLDFCMLGGYVRVDPAKWCEWQGKIKTEISQQCGLNSSRISWAE